jgi:hypothetical protein
MTVDDVMTAMWESTCGMMRASDYALEWAALMTAYCLGLTLRDVGTRLRQVGYPEGRDGYPGRRAECAIQWLDGDAWRTIHRQWWELDGEHTLTLRQEWGLP